MTLVALGKKPYIVVTESSSYVARYNMIAAVVSNPTLPRIIFSPQDQRVRNMKGISGDMLLDLVENVSCPSINTLDNCSMYLILDKSTIHNAANIEQAFRNAGCTGSREVFILPTQAAKRVSPLDKTPYAPKII